MKFKYILLFLATLLMGFGIGFSYGAFPETWRELIGLRKKDLIVVFSSEALVPSEAFLDFERHNGCHLQVKISESPALFSSDAQKADLVFAPMSWVESLPAQESLGMKELNANLSSDFQSFKLSPEKFLPVFWQIENREKVQKMTLWGFSKISQRSTQELVEFLLSSPARIKKWSDQVQKASTLELSNVMPNFSDDLRARRIREYSLSQLKVE